VSIPAKARTGEERFVFVFSNICSSPLNEKQGWLKGWLFPRDFESVPGLSQDGMLIGEVR
jgi:hypothetical protein